MKRRPVSVGKLVVALLAVAVLGLVRLPGARAAVCIPNVDGHGDSAVVVDPTGPFLGTVDASGCDFGVYVGAGHSATITGATVFGAADSDVAVDGSATISYSTLTQSDMGVYVGVSRAAQAVISHNTIEYSATAVESVPTTAGRRW